MRTITTIMRRDIANLWCNNVTSDTKKRQGRAANMSDKARDIECCPLPCLSCLTTDAGSWTRDSRIAGERTLDGSAHISHHLGVRVVRRNVASQNAEGQRANAASSAGDVRLNWPIVRGAGNGAGDGVVCYRLDMRHAVRKVLAIYIEAFLIVACAGTADRTEGDEVRHTCPDAGDRLCLRDKRLNIRGVGIVADRAIDRPCFVGTITQSGERGVRSNSALDSAASQTGRQCASRVSPSERIDSIEFHILQIRFA